MTTPPASDRHPGQRLDPSAAHRHSPRCFWDLYHGGWRCPPREREDTHTSSTRIGTA